MERVRCSSLHFCFATQSRANSSAYTRVHRRSSKRSPKTPARRLTLLRGEAQRPRPRRLRCRHVFSRRRSIAPADVGDRVGRRMWAAPSNSNAWWPPRNRHARRGAADIDRADSWGSGLSIVAFPGNGGPAETRLVGRYRRQPIIL